MRLSRFFLPLLKEVPREANTASHKLMLRAGMIRQQSAGIYSWLPLGLMILKNVANIIRNSMDHHGMIEMLAPCVQNADLWTESGRIDAYGKEMLRFADRHNNPMLFGPTAEEMITSVFKDCVKSYKELPKILYNIQWKFRDEIRPRFGVLRSREFLMKDAYSFDIDKKSAIESYNMVYDAYFEAFNAMGLKVIPVVADTGPIGGDLSHEFHIMAPSGESRIYYDEKFESTTDAKIAKTLYAAAEEKHDPKNSASHIKSGTSIEIGHIFYFGTKYTVPMKAFVINREGRSVPVEMGSYGIGISRVVAAIIEASHDERGIIWPDNIAPFNISLINLHINDTAAVEYCDTLYNNILTSCGLKVLYDDTNERPGVKFATHDLIGSPRQIIVNKDKLLDGVVEIKNRRTNLSQTLSIDALSEAIKLNILCD